jgi:hypothetical protein
MAITEQRRPSGLVAGAIPDPNAVDRCAETVSFRSSSIGHMRYRGRHRPTAITGEQRRPDAEAPPALGPDQHPSRVEAEYLSVACEPLEARVAVLDRYLGLTRCEKNPRCRDGPVLRTH